jgi:hypothetical protein
MVMVLLYFRKYFREYNRTIAWCQASNLGNSDTYWNSDIANFGGGS